MNFLLTRNNLINVGDFYCKRTNCQLPSLGDSLVSICTLPDVSQDINGAENKIDKSLKKCFDDQMHVYC